MSCGTTPSAASTSQSGADSGDTTLADTSAVDTTAGDAQAKDSAAEVGLSDAAPDTTADAADGAADVAKDGSDASETTGDVAPAPAIALAELATAVAVELCKANFDTCPPEMKIPYATQPGCVAAVGAADATDFGKLAALVAAGKLTYDPAAAAECLAWAASTCSDFALVEGPPICTKVFVGKGAVGSTCGYNVECASDFCYAPGSCAGKCKKRAVLGASCTDKDMCEAGAVCSGGVCVANVPKDVGAACNPLKCKEGLYCASTDKCAPLVKLGGSCDMVGACVAASQCIDNGAGGKCQPMPKSGEPCAVDILADVSTQCAAGLVCFNDGSEVGNCTAKVPIGGTCVNSSHCGGWDVHCIGPEGQKTCQLLSTKGGPCQTGDLTIGEWGGCLDPYTCAKGTCIDLPGLGQPCADDILKQCGDEFMCNFVDNKCEALPGLGETCYGLCKTGLDCDLAVEPNVCKPASCQ